MHRNKFSMGNKVTVTDVADYGKAYIVTAVVENTVNNMFGTPGVIDFGTELTYRYRLKSLDGDPDRYVDERSIEMLPKTEEEIAVYIFSESLNQSPRPQPKFVTGDIVTIPASEQDRQYVISEAIEIDGLDEVVYEMFPTDNDSQVMSFTESELKLSYHDVCWEHELNESVSNGLPAWRGKIYNVYDYCSRDLYIDTKFASDFDKDTLPPDRMVHILRSHAVNLRIYDVLRNTQNGRMPDNRNTVINDLGITARELDMLISSIELKILSINNAFEGKGKGFKTLKPTGSMFTEQEMELIVKVNSLDISKGKLKDHYPADMSAMQIMVCIRDAYHTAKKAGNRVIQASGKGDDSLSAPVRGKVLYEGVSKSGMIIQFWYNFDKNFIETAYPVRMTDNVKEH